MPKYECDKCGACCAFPIIEIYYLDIVREPKLAEHCPRSAGYDPSEDDEGMHREFALACGKKKPCPMLAEDKSCSIYPTRPTCCVTFEAGCELCQEARQSHGLSPLLPKEPANG